MNIQSSKPYWIELEIRIVNIEFLLALGGRVGPTPGGPMDPYSRPPKPAEDADPPGSPLGGGFRLAPLTLGERKYSKLKCFSLFRNVITKLIK